MQGSHILLIDDDREIRWALAAILRREGAQVTEGADGEEGLRFLMRGAFDLLITDVCMPGLGGFGLYATLRFGEGPDLDWARTLPVILMSGKVTPRDLAHALDSGVDDVFEKPCDPEEFKARVRAALRRAKLVRGSRARTHGDLSDFGMSALAQALHLSGRSARLSLQSSSASAMLDFHGGQITHARLDVFGAEYRGEEAAIRALGLDDGVFEILKLPDSAPRTVFEDTSALLLRAAAFDDEVTAEVNAEANLESVAGPPEST